jgi:type 1 glutamine amidotransferase
MKRFSFIIAATLTAFSFCAFSSPSFAQNKIKVALVTGGHAFEAGAFYAVFNSMQTITYDTLVQPNANAVIASPGIDKYDVLVFYDTGDSLSASQQQAYIDLLNKGKAMIFLHHSLVSYQKWPEFIKIVGGQYHTNPVVVNGDTLHANYQHDVSIPIKVEHKNHPVTRGLSDFEIFDEVYWDAEILASVKPLLSTTHPKSMKYVAWVNRYGKSDVLYIGSSR